MKRFINIAKKEINKQGLIIISIVFFLILINVHPPLLYKLVSYKPKPILEIKVKLRVYCRDRLTIWLTDVELNKTDRIINNETLIPRYLYKMEMCTPNESYFLVFTINKTDEHKIITWNQTISKKPKYKGGYDGYVITSKRIKGKFQLIIELYEITPEKTTRKDYLSTYVEVF